MVHAALLLLMLEAVSTTNLVFTISLKRSTQNLQLSTSCRPITPSIGVTADMPNGFREVKCSRCEAAVLPGSYSLRHRRQKGEKVQLSLTRRSLLPHPQT